MRRRDLNLKAVVGEKDKGNIESMRTVEEDIQGHVVEVDHRERDIGIMIGIGRGIEINVMEGIEINMKAAEIDISVAVKTVININVRNITQNQNQDMIEKDIKTMNKNITRKIKNRIIK
jgi:hypothetical protein